VPYPCLNFVVCENLGVMVSEKRQRVGRCGRPRRGSGGGVEGTMSSR
jgi:hypothetical protein